MEVGGEGVGIGGWRLTALKYFLSNLTINQLCSYDDKLLAS